MGSIAVGRDSPLCDVITDNLALQLQVTAFAENLEPCLALVDVTDASERLLLRVGLTIGALLGKSAIEMEWVVW